MAFQKTLRVPITLCGVGLHTGDTVRARILPASADTGVRFRRVDIDPVVEIPASSRYVTGTTLATVLANGGAEVSTVEHCLAAIAGLGIDNAVVEVDGPELPILDGSAHQYVKAIFEAGWRRQNVRRRVILIEKPIRVQEGEAFFIVRPSTGLRITYSIDFDRRFPGVQHFYLDVTPETFAAELAPARTFGFLEDVQYLRAMGKAKGGTLENAIVLHEGRVLNPEGLRMPDELVRHKILDALGDLALVGRPMMGHLIVHRGGHALHDAMVRSILARPDAWSLVDPDVVPSHEELPTATQYPLSTAHA